MQSSSLGGETTLLDPAQTSSESSFILGLTNPFLLERLSSTKSSKSNTSSNGPIAQPYILILNNFTPSSSTAPLSQVTSQPSPTSPTSSTKFPAKIFGIARSYTNRKRRSSPSAPPPRTSSGVEAPGTSIQSQSSPGHWLKSDKSFLSSLPVATTTASTLTPNHATTMTIRRHFSDLTARILAPINRFMVSSPSSTDANGAAASSVPASLFPIDSFLSGLAQSSSPVPFSGQTAHGRHRARDEFYRKLCESQNFVAWMDVMNETEKRGALGMLG
jgi:hypothetical protein